MPQQDCSPETPLLGTGNGHLTKPTARNTTWIGVMVFTVLGCTCLLTTTGLYGNNSLSADEDQYEDRLYGDPCNVNATDMDEGSCNTDFYLTCDKNTSTCLCKAGMYIDVNGGTGRCLAKVGQTCTNYRGNGLPIKYCTRDAECIPDASGALRCFCKGHFLPDAFGACRATYAGPCITNAECTPNSFLKCSPGLTCTCDLEEDSQIWNATLQQCVSLIGANCTPVGAEERPCINPTKSFCQNDVSGDTCRCNPGFIPSSRNHRCAVPYNGTCDTTADCAHHLVCNLEKHCGCRNLKDQFYDSVHERCIAYAGASCMDPDENLIECVEMATCGLLISDKASITCICYENFHEENGFCVLNSGIRVHSLGFLLFLASTLIFVKYLFHN